MAEQEQEKEQEKKQFKVLIIDDDKMSSKFLAKRFEKRGYITTCLNDETKYAEVLAETEYDLVILDWLMPNISGIDVLKGIREKWKSLELPVIMVTANDEDQNIIEALNTGANDYLVKPVNMDIAFARVDTQIELKELSKAFQKQKETSALNAMIVTYNHEINNPLTIALGYLNLPLEKLDEEKKQKCINALIRIADIVKKIENLDNLEMVSYPGDSKMVNIS